MRHVLIFVIAWVLVAGTSPANAADPVSDGQWFHQFLNTAQAHQLTRGDGITVAVLDTGVDASHPDLSGSILSGTDLTGGGSDGRVDTHGHGTAMASHIAAHGRVKGVAPAAKILPVRTALIDEGSAAKLAAGIRWAVAQGVKIISISRVAFQDSDLLRQEVQAALAADVVVVAGVGNRPKSTSVGYPAAYPGVVAVAGVDQAGKQSSISVSGSSVVISAPSDNISGANPAGKYVIATGTSDATAIVAGAVALIRAKFPQLKAPEVIRRLTATAIDKGPTGRDPDYGFGVLNLVGALTAELPAATNSPTGLPTLVVPTSEPGRSPWRLLTFIVIPVAALVVIAAALLLRRRNRGGAN